jgi:hypothetical protein
VNPTMRSLLASRRAFMNPRVSPRVRARVKNPAYERRWSSVRADRLDPVVRLTPAE